MSLQSLVTTKLNKVQEHITFLPEKNISSIYKQLIAIGVVLFLFYVLVSNHHIDHHQQAKFRQSWAVHNENHHIDSHPTNISHIFIGIAGSMNSWKSRKPYIEAWWEPNVTKGYLFLDREPTEFLPWPASTPPYRLYEDTTRYLPYDRHSGRHVIRMLRVIVQAFKEAPEGVRWFVMADDDTILFLDDLVDILSSYDHRKYFYIGENSESLLSNFDNSFEMAFGGAGYAISYPLAEALAKNMDVCIKRYPTLFGSDFMMQSCVADLGVSLTHEKGFHQIDLHRDLSGYLSTHPQSPFLSLHHLDAVEPLFPSMNRYEALNHLMKPAKVDQSRLLQQTICYDNSKNWSYSIAWGYSVQLYENIIPPSVLQKPLETFTAWRKPPRQPFMFNTRWLSNNPCEMPHLFFFESVELITKKNVIVTSYTRRSPRTLPPCNPSSNGNFTTLPSDIAKIIVFSPATKYSAKGGSRRECCDVLDQVEKNITMIKYRACRINEIVGLD